MSTSISNKEAAGMLEEIGIMLELLGENPFKARAHYSVSRTVENLGEPLEIMVGSGRLSSIKGIGKGMNKKLTELVETGKISEYHELRESIPPGLWDMLKIPGLGPKKVRDIYKKLNISTIGELEYACRENRLVTLEGFGKRSQEKTIEGIEFHKKVREQHHIHNARKMTEVFSDLLLNLPGIKKTGIVGEVRRHCEIVNTLEFVVCIDLNDTIEVIDRIRNIAEISKLTEENKNSILIKHSDGFLIRLYFSDEKNYPIVLFQQTGSKEHVSSAIRSKFRKEPVCNDSGVLIEPALDGSDDESEIYKRLGIPLIPPELRENSGEIEDSLPRLISDNDIKGILHVHTTYSDGVNTLDEMVNTCIDAGYGYLGICDHSQTAFYANGLQPERLKLQHEEIDTLNEKYQDFTIFKGIESDILIDGSLDYTEDILETFDFVVASVHSKLNMPKEEAQKRLEAAIRNPYTTILGHPTGRLLLSRKGYELDMVKIFEAAVEEQVVIELNASPYRLDIDWRSCKLAREMGVKIAINPDAHSIHGLDDIRYGVGIARKGWLEPDDVINCLISEDIGEYFKNRKIIP